MAILLVLVLLLLCVFGPGYRWRVDGWAWGAPDLLGVLLFVVVLVILLRLLGVA